MVKSDISSETDRKNSIKQLRKLILDDIEAGRVDSSIGQFHPYDLKRIQEDTWLDNFLIFHDYNINDAFSQCWATLEWRAKYFVNDITENSLKMEDLINGNIYIRGTDIDGKHIMFFRIRLYARGSRTLDELQIFFLYWVERGLRLTKGDQITLVLDMQGAGVKNMDLEYTRMMISIFKNYYPNSMNYMLVFDMPFIMNGIFQIIKGLLPKKVLERMKFINSKSAKNYISESHQPKEWGGKDDYELKFEQEQFDDESGVLLKGNNNSPTRANLNLPIENKKVHFASSSPMSETSYENHRFGDMLSLTPAETIIFQKSSNGIEFSGNVEITNISKKSVTYKVKTTAPDKFRVRPSSGTILPNSSTTIHVVIQKGQQAIPINKDKFLVMCMSLPEEEESLTNDEIVSLWKEITAASPEVEQHRLKCALPGTMTSAIINNDMIEDYFLDNNASVSTGHHNYSSLIQNGTKQPISQHHLQGAVNHLSETVNQMQHQMKSFQSLQWITIFVFILLAIAIIYILKMEIQNQNSQYCIDK